MKKILCVVLCCVACAGAEKAGEDNPPIDGKADSFRNPTTHGVLPFDTSSTASLSADEKFHAWNFSLSGQADIDINLTASERSLDTVMYLYRRTDPSATWGRYIARNDDDGERVQSRIDGAYDAADYRIIVKGFKDITYGRFSVEIGCEGEGCTPIDNGEVTTPVETFFTQECEELVYEAGSGVVVESSRLSVPVNPPATFDKALRLASLHYQELTEANDVDDDGDVTTFDARIQKRSTGIQIEMSDGGDESITDYLFDRDGNIVAYYVHNQSPWTGYFCAEPGEEDIGAPDDECLNRWMINGIRTGDVSSGEGSFTVGGDNSDIELVVRNTLQFRVDTDEDDVYLEGDEITFQYDVWSTGAEVYLYDDGTIYTSVQDGSDTYVVFESSENHDDGIQMICGFI